MQDASSRFDDVIEGNRAILARAIELNNRAGTDIFPVVSQADLASMLETCLAGATCIADIQNPDALRFPELDKEQVAEVLRDYPDTLCVLGSELPVDYLCGSWPQVTLTEEMMVAHRWRDLPDAGVVTPGGKRVEVIVNLDHFQMKDRDIPALKAKLLQYCNQQQWRSWQRPTIVLPDLSSEKPVIPDICEVVYGRCVVTGADLIAYGAVCRASELSLGDPHFAGHWFQHRIEAEQYRSVAESRLGEVLASRRQHLAFQAVKVEADVALGALRGLSSRPGWSGLARELRGRVEARASYIVSSGLEAIRTWTTKTNALVAEAEAALQALGQSRTASTPGSLAGGLDLSGLKARFHTRR